MQIVASALIKYAQHCLWCLWSMRSVSCLTNSNLWILRQSSHGLRSPEVCLGHCEAIKSPKGVCLTTLGCKHAFCCARWFCRCFVSGFVQTHVFYLRNFVLSRAQYTQRLTLFCLRAIIWMLASSLVAALSCARHLMCFLSI